jgi:hypothetical protein
MGRNDEYLKGEREGIRKAIEWLHQRAKLMNDPKAAGVLNTAAFHLGLDLKRTPDLRKLEATD